MRFRYQALTLVGTALLLAAGCGILHLHRGPRVAYRVIDLKPLPGGKTSQVFDLSDTDAAVGRADFAGSLGHQHAVVWEKDQPPRDLGTVDGGGSEADKISPGGQIAGWASSNGTQIEACKFPGSRPQIFSTADTSMSLAFGVADNGVVGVMSGRPGGSVHSVLTGSKAPGDLGVLPGYRDTMATAMSTTGIVVGTSDDGRGEKRAFVWTPATPPASTPSSLGAAGSSGSLRALPLPAGYTSSFANAVSPGGLIAGSCSIGPAAFHAVVWRNGQPEALSASADKESEAYAVDDAGDVVGECNNHACLWRKGHLVDLNQVTGQHVHTVLNSAVAITSNGVIACNGIVNKQIHAFLLIPNHRS